MARSRTSTEEHSEKVFAPIFVKAAKDPVRVRVGPGIQYSHISDSYLTDIPAKVTEIVPGQGSKAGWGNLEGSHGWVAMDFVEVVSK